MAAGATDVDLSPLFAPLTVNGLTLPNRFVMPGMQRGWGDDGRVSDRMIDYYVQRVRGGAGLVITEGLVVDHPAAALGVGELRLDPGTSDGWARCAEAIKAAGGATFMQFWHPGAVRTEDHDPAVPPLSPSGRFAGRPHGRAATKQDLDDLAGAWVTAAVTAQAIGFDGVELHMAHGFLLHQFLWRETNRRTDGWGGDAMADRARFPARVLRDVRRAVGPDFVISCRISQWAESDYDARVARTPQELAELVAVLDAGGTDLFHMSTRYFQRPEWPERDSRGLAGWVKSMTTKPVVTVGSLGLDIDMMSTLFTERPEGHPLEAGLRELVARYERGEFDLVAVGRSMIGDPRFVEKLRAGRLDEIRPFTRADLADHLAGLEGHELPDEIRSQAQDAARAGGRASHPI
jgi:2,4-dienoyl-CoA reductase-like NADH-dependent reductase (Old Yellow Enzyme family)